jgi:hypothetical protein
LAGDHAGIVFVVGRLMVGRVMKTYLTYGFAMAVGGMLLTLVLFFLGFHSSADKLSAANWLGFIGGCGIGIACIVLGTKVRRAEVPATEEFGYGRALGTGVMITLFAALFGIVTTYLYFQLINPGFLDLTVQARLDEMEAKGVSGAALEQAEKMVRMMMKPAIMAAFGFVGGMINGPIISLITAAFLKRTVSDEPPALG